MRTLRGWRIFCAGLSACSRRSSFSGSISGAPPAPRCLRPRRVVGETRQIVRAVEHALRRQMRHLLGTALDIALDQISRAPITSLRNRSITFGHTTILAMPVSSSSVMNTTPLALPGRCRTSTTPAQRTRCLSLAWQISLAGDDALARKHRRARIPSDVPSVTGGWSGSRRPPVPAAASAGSGLRLLVRLLARGGASNSGSAHIVGQPPHRHNAARRSSPSERNASASASRISARLGRPVSRAKSSSEVKGRRSRAATMRSAQSS